MPELPEVETIKRQLHDRLKGRVISAVEIWKTGREKPVGGKFRGEVVGKKLRGVERRAKMLIFQFTDGSGMIGHLKMTGKFLFVPKSYTQQKHDRILFVLDGGKSHLVWSDIRTFGYLHFVKATEPHVAKMALGPEPLETAVEVLADRLKSPKTRTIKAALLNQECVAGVGNIYADEACHRAGIRPTRRLSTLTENDRRNVMQEVRKVLQESIDQKGTSANDYVDTNGTRGGFLSLLKVYGRDGESCLSCKTPIKKIVLAGRGTHYCPTCQK